MRCVFIHGTKFSQIESISLKNQDVCCNVEKFVYKSSENKNSLVVCKVEDVI